MAYRRGRNWIAGASMGPRSDNRGYVDLPAWRPHGRRELQWVHGQITVVMVDTVAEVELGREAKLQWVHGRITVVMSAGSPGRYA